MKIFLWALVMNKKGFSWLKKVKKITLLGLTGTEQTCKQLVLLSVLPLWIALLVKEQLNQLLQSNGFLDHVMNRGFILSKPFLGLFAVLLSDRMMQR